MTTAERITIEHLQALMEFNSNELVQDYLSDAIKGIASNARLRNGGELRPIEVDRSKWIQEAGA